MVQQKAALKPADSQLAILQEELASFRRGRIKNVENMKRLFRGRAEQRKRLTEWLDRQGALAAAATLKDRQTLIRELAGPGGARVIAQTPRSASSQQRDEWRAAIPTRDIQAIYPWLASGSTCNCGMVELYHQPPWSGSIWGPNLYWWLWGDGQAPITSWNDAPPDFGWVTRPQAGQVTTATAEMAMSLQGGGDGWNQSWADVAAEAFWRPTQPGRFRAHFHFGGSGGPSAALHGDGELFWPEAGYLGAWLYFRVAHDNADGNWTLLHQNRVQIADIYDTEDVNGLGQMTYWTLDHWMATEEFDIPVGRRVSIVGSIEFETSAEDGECYSGVHFGPTDRLTLRPVVTGTQCGVVQAAGAPFVV